MVSREDKGQYIDLQLKELSEQCELLSLEHKVTLQVQCVSIESITNLGEALAASLQQGPALS